MSSLRKHTLMVTACIKSMLYRENGKFYPPITALRQSQQKCTHLYVLVNEHVLLQIKHK